MKNSKALFRELVNKISLDDNPDEVYTIVYIILEHFFALSRTDIMAEKEVMLTPQVEQRLKDVIDRINRHEPVQYVLDEAVFFGRKFHVNPAVLIPRPETEEIVRVVLQYNALYSEKKKNGIKICDIGTGSGCIAITLALEIPGAKVCGTDISEAALAVARQNADKLGADVNFVQHNILSGGLPESDLDVIVSNPPYITPAEKAEMKKNVMNYEPHLALFVPENDPLLFYNVITCTARETLRPGGLLCVEVNEKFGKEIAQLLTTGGFKNVHIVKDMNNKERIISGVKA